MGSRRASFLFTSAPLSYIGATPAFLWRVSRVIQQTGVKSYAQF